MKTAFTKLLEARESVDNHKVAIDYMLEISGILQRNLSAQLASIANAILAAVFDDPYEVIFEFEVKAKRVECSLGFRRGDRVIFDGRNAIEGGVQDCVAFALRLAIGILVTPRHSTFVFDEPFRFIHASRHESLLRVVESLADSRGIQVIWVTHDSGFVAGNVISVDGIYP